MKEELFQGLLESVRQAGAIRRGEMKPGRVFEFPDADVPELDVGAVRRRQQLSQTQFARAFGISVGTLRNWEQGRRRPVGPARVLLAVADKHPEIVFQSVRAEMENGGATLESAKSNGKSQVTENACKYRRD